MQQTQTYRQRSRNFLVKAMEELNAGDLEQASAKGWGAAVAILKVIAEDREWDHRSHRALNDAVANLVQETGDDDLHTLFFVASAMHVNFYENWYRPTSVESGIRQVERFVNKVELLLSTSA